MILGLISDIHGNLLALDKCLKHLRRMSVDDIYFLGDAVGYIPDAKRVIDRLMEEGIHCQKGNHEEMLLTKDGRHHERAYRLQETKAQFNDQSLRNISSWPLIRSLSLGHYNALLVHGSPSAPIDGYIYPEGPLPSTDDIAHDIVFMGHTHRPFIREVSNMTFVNIGSVGLPRDHGNLACFATLECERCRTRLFRVPFDARKVVAEFGQRLHSDVRTCLARKDGPVVGDVLE